MRIIQKRFKGDFESDGPWILFYCSAKEKRIGFNSESKWVKADPFLRSSFGFDLSAHGFLLELQFRYKFCLKIDLRKHWLIRLNDKIYLSRNHKALAHYRQISA